MDLKSAADFLALANKNETIQKQLKAVSSEGVIELGKANGFNFTMEEFKQVITQVSALKDAGEDQLSDEDMEHVTGGVAVLTVIGLTAAVISLACSIDSLAYDKGWW